MRNFLVIAALFIAVSCSGIKRIEKPTASQVDTTKLYSQDFVNKINAIKETYRLGQIDKAYKALSELKTNHLNASELATVRNLNGVILFSQKRYQDSALEFEGAVLQAHEDPTLMAQGGLNLASSYYKMGNNEKAYEALKKINYANLNDAENKKYQQLYVTVSEALGKQDQKVIVLIRSLNDRKTINEATVDVRFNQAYEIFKNLPSSDRVRIIEEFEDEPNMAVAYLAFKEAEVSFNNGDKSRMNDILGWIKNTFPNNAEVDQLIASLNTRIDNQNAKINITKIGVVLPLSGQLKSLGERAMAGMDVAVDLLNKQGKGQFSIEIRDSKGNAAQGAFAVKELIERYNVAAVVGGLNIAEATRQYQEAKKHGIVYISLSKVLLPKEEKNHLLIEIPSSIESQIGHLFRPEVISKVGKRPAIIYPKTDLGEAYATEFWRTARAKGYEVTGLMPYDVGETDFREPVKNMLGIKFTRERQEEFELVNQIAELEKKKSVKRLQSLQPQVDFDWVFVPTLPREAMQIIPNFNFFDAFNLTFVGLPSWRTQLMTNESYRYGSVFFMDEQVVDNNSEFAQKFRLMFNRDPKFVEVLGFDGLKLYIDLIQANGSISSRQDLDLALLNSKKMRGESGIWSLEDDIWIKDMNTYRIKRDGISQIK